MNASKSETALKAAILTKLRSASRIGKHTVIANELTLGTSGVRADLALQGRKLIGIEVKSERDSLRRLEKQVHTYLMYFDEVLLVLAEKHALAAPSSILSQVELWIATPKGKLVIVHTPDNRYEVEKSKRIELLTLRERNKWLSTIPKPTSSEISEAFHQAFRNKFLLNSQEFWRNVEGRGIEVDDLHTLSRFREKRLLAADANAAKEKLWNQWAKYRSLL